MRLLVVTQAVDQGDPALGFFHGWIEALAERFESIEVICLTEGRHELPMNVRMHSLGRERGDASRFAYAARFLALAWRLRNSYDAVFVHMNQEYVLLAGWLWLVLNKPVYLWRNHYAGSLATDIAAALSRAVFCTSAHSYTAKYAKTVLMPVGLDTGRFYPGARIPRAPRSILFLARMAPSKRPDMLVEALGILTSRDVAYTADVVGSPSPANEAYYERLKARAAALGLAERVRFLPGVGNWETPALYRAHTIFVNCSPSGMFDKTLFEAAACGARVLAASEDFARLAGSECFFDSAETLVARLERVLAAPAPSTAPPFIARHSLTALADRLAAVIAARYSAKHRGD